MYVKLLTVFALNPNSKNILKFTIEQNHLMEKKI